MCVIVGCWGDGRGLYCVVVVVVAVVAVTGLRLYVYCCLGEDADVRLALYRDVI